MAVLQNATSGLYEDLPDDQAQKAAQSGSHLVPLNDPEDNPLVVPYDEAQRLLGSDKGYSQPTPEQLSYLLKASKYQTPEQTAKAVAEAAARGATLGQSTLVEKALGVKPEAIRSREEMLGMLPKIGAETLGFAVSPVAGPLGAAGEAVAGGLGLGAEGAGALSRIGAQSAKLATESALMTAGDQLSQMYVDPDKTVASALPAIGLSALIGSGLGAGFGTVAESWKALADHPTAQILTAIKNKMTPLEEGPPPPPSPARQAVDVAGIGLSPELNAAIEHPEAVLPYQHLIESPTYSGQEVQKLLGRDRLEISNGIARVLGKTPEQVDALENYSVFNEGKDIGQTLAKEIKATTDPLAQDFDAINEKYATAKIGESRKDKIANRILEFAQEHKYDLPGTPQNKLINNIVYKWLPTVANLEDLKGVETLVNQQTSGFQNQSLWHVGGGIKDIFREYEAKVVAQRLAEKEPELVGRYELASKVYAEEKKYLSQLNDRLSVGRFTGPKTFLKRLEELAPEDLYRRITQKGDAGLLQILSERYPETAAAVKEAHINNILRSAARGAKEPFAVNTRKLLNNINEMSPELRDFVLNPYQRERIAALQQVSEMIPDKMNTSGTAKSLMSLISNVPTGLGSVLALATGHNPISGALFGGLTHMLSTEGPDAIKRGLLKALGSDKAASGAGLKAAVDMAKAMQKGAKLIEGASKNVFKPGAVVLPSTFFPDETSRKKLDDRVSKLKEDQSSLLNIAKDVGHYLPDHAASIGATSLRAIEYLSSLKPVETKMAPLDGEAIPSQVEESRYDRALDLAEQPLIAMQSIKDGTLVPDDVNQIKTISPALYSAMSQGLYEGMVEHLAKGEDIPYSTSLSLSLFLGQPLDSTMIQTAIAAAQPSPSAPNAAPSQQPKIKRSAASLSKSPPLLQTQLQARESSRLTHGA